MRVLQIVTHMNCGGLETMLMNYYRRIDRSQVQFDFLVHRQERANYDDEIEALGGIIYRLPRLSPWSLTYRKALDDFFCTHKEYKIVHSHLDCMSAIPLAAAQKYGIPIRIAHSHSCNQDKNLKYPIKRYYKRKICKYATELFACSQAAGQWMFCGAPFLVLNNAIEANLYRYDRSKAEKARKELNIANSALVIGHVGRFSPTKNHTFLMEIFDVLQQKIPDARLLLVGDGTLRQTIEEKTEKMGLTKKVIFTGVQSDVASLMQAMDVFVFPSHYEGLPVALVEAQAAGLPCLISDRVPIECKKTNLVRSIALSEPPEVWADAIVGAAKQDRTDTYKEIRRAGYDIAENAKQLQQFYQSSVEREKAECLF